MLVDDSHLKSMATVNCLVFNILHNIFFSAVCTVVVDEECLMKAIIDGSACPQDKICLDSLSDVNDVFCEYASSLI